MFSTDDCEWQLSSVFCWFDSDELFDHFSDMLFVGSDLSVRIASLLTDLICSLFKILDECSTAFQSLIKKFFSLSKLFCSGFSNIRNAKKCSIKSNLFYGSHRDSHFVWWVLLSNCVIAFKGTLIKFWVTQNFESKTAIAIWNVLCHPQLRWNPRVICFSICFFSHMSKY